MNELTKSNKLIIDKLGLKEDVEIELLKFIKLQIQKTNNEDSFLSDVMQTLNNRMDNDELSDIVLVKLVEIFLKQKNEMAISIMDMVKNNKNNNQDTPIVDNEGSEENKSSLTKDDVSGIKDLLKTIEKVKKAEF